MLYFDIATEQILYHHLVAIGGIMQDTNFIYIAFIVLGLGLVILAMVQSSKAKKAGKSWLSTPGRITSSVVETRRERDMDGDRHTYHEPKIAYEYQVNELTYQGDAIGFRQKDNARSKSRADRREVSAG